MKCEITKDEAKKRYPLIPSTTIDGLYLYVDKRCRTGDFLRAVLCNDSQGAQARADRHNRPALQQISQFVYNEMPGPCWGSEEAVDEWLHRKEKPVAQTN